MVEDTEGLRVEVIFLVPGQFPYLSTEQMKIHAADIVDMDGRTIIKDISSEPAKVENGMVILPVFVENLPSGKYRLQISEWESSKKADQPLVLYGDWECEFVW